MENVRNVGRIIKVSPKGWGFISCRDIEFTRIFFHWTSLKQETLSFKELKVGMYAEFTAVKVPEKGVRAIHLIIVEKPVLAATVEPLDTEEVDDCTLPDGDDSKEGREKCGCETCKEELVEMK